MHTVFLFLLYSSSSWAWDTTELLQAQLLLQHPGPCIAQGMPASALLCARPCYAGTPQLTPQDLALLHGAQEHKASALLGSQNRFHRISKTLHSASLTCLPHRWEAGLITVDAILADKVILSCCSGAILVDTSLRLPTAHYIGYSEWNET